jgi:hypothetical protein
MHHQTNNLLFITERVDLILRFQITDIEVDGSCSSSDNDSIALEERSRRKKKTRRATDRKGTYDFYSQLDALLNLLHSVIQSTDIVG